MMIVIDSEVILFPLGLALRQVTIRLTRDGEITSGLKTAALTSPDVMTVAAVFTTADGVTDTQLFLASAVDKTWILIAADTAAPKRAAGVFVTISEDLIVSADLNNGTGGGGGVLATLGARVRVDGVGSAREVLAVERKTDGAWRVAGSLRTSDGALDLRVAGGEVYAMALDDWGIQYQSGLAVIEDQVIRPSVFTGWLYRITEAGTLPAAEPEWWPAEGDNASRLLGTARAIAVRYYQPLAHGPLPVELL